MSVNLSPQFTRRDFQWTAWKAVYEMKGLPFQYDNDGTLITIWTYDASELLVCQIFAGTVPDSIALTYSQAQNDADKADFIANYQSQGNEPLNPSYSGSYILPISVAPSTLTNATNFWAMRNNPVGEKMFIMKIVLTLNYGGLLNSLSASSLNFCRFSGATPSTGTSLSAIKTNSQSPTSTLISARQSNGGINMNGATIEGGFLPINVISQSTTSTTFNFLYPLDHEFSLFCLQPGEGLCLQANGSLLSGCLISGFIQWVER